MRIKIKTSIYKDFLDWYIVILIIIKTVLVGGICILDFTTAVHDDALMADMAKNLLDGNWLGTYDNRRLVKGITFPVFLVMNYFTGMPYTITIALLYGLACAVFAKVMNRLIKNKMVSALLFTILYFVPVHVSVHTFIRVYRNVLLPILVLLIFACFIGMYFMRGEKKCLVWSVCSGLLLAAFWNLREDAVWILPFALVVSGITIFRIVWENRSTVSKYVRLYVMCAVFPFVILGCVNIGIKCINNYCYGSFVRNELSEGEFPLLMKTIYSIKPTEDIDYVSVPKSTLDRLFEVSPGFCILKPALEANFGAGWDSVDGKLDGQIPDGWFLWCMRDCITASGYDTPKKINELCSQITDEIQEAFRNGDLQKRSGMAMPSALMSPWKKSYLKKLPQAIADAFWFVAEHKECGLHLEESDGNIEDIQMFETLTHNQAVYPDSEILEIGGWIVSDHDEDSVTFAVCQDGSMIDLLPHNSGQDVFALYADNGKYLENAKNSRFYKVLSVDMDKPLQFAVMKNGTIIDHISFSTDFKGTSHTGDGYTWHLDTVELTSQKNQLLIHTAETKISILEKVNALYRACGKSVTVAGLCSYFVITICFLHDMMKKKQSGLLDQWLVVSGLLGSVLVLCTGVAYTHVSAYHAINQLYLAGGYPLLTAFSFLSICFFVQRFDECRQVFYKGKKTNQKGDKNVS